ncbi:MAG: hypothetical protein NC131_01465 [Roseburia sp.]|nr:hypothetical protein [Roseburia sp.]
MNRKKRTLFKSAVIGVTALATSLTLGMSAACAKSGGNSADTDDDKTTTKIDGQTIKNGNFEFYSDNDGLYPISSPDSWTSGSNGTTSASMSGVIDTGKERWNYFASDELAQTLEANDDLESTDENKKDYNGALADDLPYKNTHTATETEPEEEDAKDFIANPYTHSYSYDDTCGENEVLVDGVKQTTYTDDNGDIYLDSEFTKPLETSVLMLHNYNRSNFNGSESYYNSSTTVSLEANTAAEFSVWVKTAEMYFSNAKNERSKVVFDRGAYIKVKTQVGGNSLDDIVIKNIDTEKINPDGENNGWVKYTVYVVASTFATTSVSLTLGLGNYDDNESTVEGYAFFDDVSVKKYRNQSDMETNSSEGWAKIHETATPEQPDVNVTYPLAPDAQSDFRVDKESYKTEDGNGGIKDQQYGNNFDDRHFFIDFSSSAFKETNPVDLNTQTVKAGLTVEDTSTGKYVCTAYDSDTNAYHRTDGLGGISNSSDRLYIPTTLRTNPINVKDDVLALTTITGEDWTFDDFGTGYSEKIITPALKTAATLPDADGSTPALVMLSARGASYEAQISDDGFTLDNDEYMLVSFWLKTSNMQGNTAATVTVVGLDGNGKEDENVTSSFTVDSTMQSTVTIGEGEDEVKDVYNGWVRCFIRVSNTSKTDGKQFKIKVNFGTTSIRSASTSAFKYGWVAIANPSVMKLSEDVYDYTSDSSLVATIGFTETTEQTSHIFDNEKGEKNEINRDLATPSSYTGVNGASKFVDSTNTVTLDGYDDTNKNAYAGLLNKDNFKNYASRYEESKNDEIVDCMWYNALQTIAGSNLDTSEKLWNAVFGGYTVQPLLIVNTVREFKNTAEEGSQSKIYNYGYIGNSATVSSNSYSAVSVKVKASAGAIANVYLVEDKSGGNVLSYTTPEYNFWYDADGNILKGEPDKDATAAEQKENIAYTLRKDGLYENGDGKLYANFYNLTKQYDISFEHENFYDADGKAVRFEDLVKGETYYNASGTAYAPHYLIAGGKDNNKVYLYNSGLGESASYYYVENGKANKAKLVYGINTAEAELRYKNSEGSKSPYQFTIDTNAHPEYADKWITVTFYIHAGAETKNYKLELWSGERDKQSSYADSATPSYVIFDYSDHGNSLDQTAYDGLVGKYTEDITEEYKKIIVDDGTELENNDANIAELEALAGSGNKVDLYDYDAAYYTFSLFDSEAFIPFNGETDSDGTGYSFDYSESKESLTYLKVIDNGLPYGSADTDSAIYTMSSFIDYSVIDKDIDIIGEPTAPDNSSSDSGTSSSGNTTNTWLLASSIVLVIAIFVAIAAIFIKDFLKKRKQHVKSVGKNSYNFNKNKRYVKKYVKSNGDVRELTEENVDESLLSDKPAETVENTQTADSQNETSETSDADTAAEVNSEEAVNGAEAEASETSAEDTPSENGNDSSEGDSDENKE